MLTKYPSVGLFHISLYACYISESLFSSQYSNSFDHVDSIHQVKDTECHNNYRV